MDEPRKSLYFWRMTARRVISDISRIPVRLNNPPLLHHCEKGWDWKPKPLSDYDLWWVLDGVGNVNLNGTDFPVGPGVCFVFLPGSRILGTQDPERRLKVFASHFSVEEHPGSHKVEAALRSLPPATKVRDTSWLTALATRAVPAFRRNDPLGREQARLCVQQMVLHLIQEASAPPLSAIDDRVLEIVNAIHGNPGAVWYVEDMAKRAHLSRAQFTRRFEALTGKAPARYVIQTRLERARQLIVETEMKLSQIAEALGYQDLYFFSRQYKQCFGHAPSEMRREVRRR